MMSENKIAIVTQDGWFIGAFENLDLAHKFAHAKNDAKERFEDKYISGEFEIHKSFSTEPKWFVRISPKGAIIEVEENGIVGIDIIKDSLDVDVNQNYIGDCSAKNESQAIQIIKTRLGCMKLSKEQQQEE